MDMVYLQVNKVAKFSWKKNFFMTKKRSGPNSGTENGFPIILWRWFVIVIWHLGKRAENGNADGKEIEWVFLRSVFTEKCASSKVQMVCLILLYRTRSWLTNLPPKSLSQCLAYVRAHSRKFCTNERRCGIPSFVGIMSYYWLELTTRADGITTVVTFWHARYLHTQHHKNSTPPNAYSISYITSAQHSKLGYFWSCVALSLSEALLFLNHLPHISITIFVLSSVRTNALQHWRMMAKINQHGKKSPFCMRETFFHNETANLFEACSSQYSALFQNNERNGRMPKMDYF